MAEDKKNLRCSFCGKPQSLVDRLIAGNGSYICDECVEMCYDLIADDAEQEPVRRQPEKGESVPTTMDMLPTPMELKALLDDYVIGQDEAKVVLAKFKA